MSPKNSGAPKKPRWTQAKKAASRRAGSPGARSTGRREDIKRDRWNDREDASRAGARTGGDRAARRPDGDGGFRRDSDPRDRGPRGGYDRPERPDRGFRGDDRGPRQGGYDRAGDRDNRREDRGFRRDDRGGWDRGARREDRDFRRDDRGPRQGGFDRAARGESGFERGERGASGRGDRAGFRRNDGGFRPNDGGFRRNDGGFRRNDGGFRPNDGGFRQGGFDRDDRAPRRDDRGFRRDDRGPRREFRDDREGFRRDDRGPRREFRDDRGGFRRDDRGPRRDFRDDRGGYRRDDREGFRRDDRGPRGGREWDRRPREDRDERYPRHDRDERYPRRDRDERGVEGGERFVSRNDHEAHRHHYDGTRRPAPADAPPARAEQLRRNEAPTPVPVDMETNGFAKLGVPEELVKRLARDGISEPFPIQEATIPDALAGKDVLGRGRTGSGKTLAFGLPLLARLAQGERATANRPKAIVLSPTRELAMQIADALQPLVHVLGLRHKLVAGGMPYPPQFDALERGVDVLIATPGRLNDLIERGAAILDDTQIVVLDEADHMADMGFLPEVTEILDLVPAGGQRLLFSATLDKGIDTLVERYLQDPVIHSTDEAQASVATMDHHILLVEPAHKKVVTAAVANRGGHTIVFVRTKLGADRVAMQLREEGVFAAALHGGLSQAARNRVLNGFKDGTLPVLVATDVAARGIHVDDVGLVMQVDPPADHKDYLHRAGRTARAGEKGTVVTLALPHQRKQMQRIADAAGLDIAPEKVAPGDPKLAEITGASRPSGVPIPEDRLRRLMEPPPRPRRGGYGSRGGYRGGRDGGRGGRQGYRGGRGGYRD